MGRHVPSAREYRAEVLRPGATGLSDGMPITSSSVPVHTAIGLPCWETAEGNGSQVEEPGRSRSPSYVAPAGSNGFGPDVRPKARIPWDVENSSPPARTPGSEGRGRHLSVAGS